jgi:hypothetical protein
MAKLTEDESAVVQVLMRPVDDDWQESVKKKIRKSEKKK